MNRCGVFFDLDGTLLDSAPDFWRLVQQLATEHALTSADYEAVRRAVSNGGAAVIRTAFNLNEQDARFQPLLHLLLERYATEPVVQGGLFEGFEQLLDWLESVQIPWGVVTNKPARFTYPIMETLKLQQRASAIICPDDVTHSKPDPEGLLLACLRSGCAPDRSIYVGDHRRDIEAAHAAGMHSVAAGYGYICPQDPVHDWGSRHRVQRAPELLDLLQSITQAHQPASTPFT